MVFFSGTEVSELLWSKSGKKRECGQELDRKQGSTQKKEKVSRRSPLHPSDWCMRGGMKGERGVGEVEEQD